MKIVIGSDHAGFALKGKVIEKLLKDGHDVVDVGPDTADRVDYPIYGGKVGKMVVKGEGDFGIVICGTGIGISIAANKIKGVRAALCNEPLSAKLARQHNDANVLAMGARIIGEAMAFAIVDTFLGNSFAGGRHENRVRLLGEMEKEYEA